MNVFSEIPAELPAELIQMLLATAAFRIERIVSRGHASPAKDWCDQAEHEWVLVLQGAATLQFEDGPIELKAGDFIHIPARRLHRVAWTTPDEDTIWLAIHYA